jgi:predicted nucleotidyltransferase
MGRLEKMIFATDRQKVLSFLIQNPDREYFDEEVSRLTGVSRSGANFALRDLAKTGTISRERRGRMCFNKALSSDVFVRYFKIVQNIATLFPLVNKLRRASLKITLYGSAAKGENTSESDVDLFILTRVPAEVEKILFRDTVREKVQCVIRTPSDFVKSKKKNPAFYAEVEKGITLWERR